LESFFYI